jgi:hypothetical protein
MDKIPPETIAVIETVLLLEERYAPDWGLIGALLDNEIDRLYETGDEKYVNYLPYYFLEDWDIRRKDEVYGESQRRKIREFLTSLASDGEQTAK